MPIKLRKRQSLIDAVNAAESGTELALSDLFALKLCFGLAAHPTVLLRNIVDFYLLPHGFHAVLVGVTQRKNVLLRVEWKPQIVRADRDHGLPTVERVVFIQLDLFLPAFIKLLLEALLVRHHIHYALIDIPAVS